MRIYLKLVSLIALGLAGCDSQSGSEGSRNSAPHEAVVGKGGHAAVDKRPHDEAVPTMRLSLSSTGPLMPGRSRSVTLALIDLATAKPMTPEDMAIAHTKKLHLLVIDASLSDYQHIHPVYDPPSKQWRFDFTPKFSRVYKVWADVTRPDMHQEYVGADLPVGTESAPPPGTSTAMTAQADGLRFLLSFPSPLKVGQAAQGSIAVVDASSGKPFVDLQPVMGAFGHIVAFAGDWNAIEHVHPLGVEPKAESDRSGPAINFHIQPEQSGVLKLFAQIRANGRETIVPFTATVAP